VPPDAHKPLVMAKQPKKAFLKDIQANIARHGHHIYLISAGTCPRFAYTIGLRPRLGAEIILAGASIYSGDDVARIINSTAETVEPQRPWQEWCFDFDAYGSFSVRKAHETWTTKLMLGALDFYGVEAISAFQLVPDEAHWTIDIPNLSAPWNAAADPAWRWLQESWEYPVPSKSVAATNLDALRGKRVTEAARWEEDQWELFAGAGPEVPREEIRVVPLGTLLAADSSLSAVVNLPVGCALWRDADSEWHPWG